MQELLSIDKTLCYEVRLDALKAAGIALWDVVGEAERPGSLDRSIIKQSVVYNAIPDLLDECAQLEVIAFNGGAAADLFARAERHWGDALRPIERVRLPSTSPANAALSLNQKCDLWRQALGPYI